MAKEFSIHDWQAKQRLNEQDFDDRMQAAGDFSDKEFDNIEKDKMVHLNQYFDDIGKMKLGDGTIDVGYAKIDLFPGKLNEQGFDDRLKAAGGFSDKEMGDITSRDIGSPFPGTDNVSPFTAKAKDYTEKFKQEYREMSDDGIDKFNKEIIEYLLNAFPSAQATAKAFFARKGL